MDRFIVRHILNSSKTLVVLKRRCSLYTTKLKTTKEPTFDKILIANRGEIACRIIKTAKKMGIKTVAIHSDIDYFTPHVKLADEAICVGTAQATDSYLKMDNILEAINTTGSQAVHPGYGFLSENAEFVKKLEDLNVAFIGPSAAAITGMGDKLQSKRLAVKAGVNTIPGFDGIIKDANHCVKVSQKIGYPVMIKASAGGGGKGMRIAWNDNEAKEGFRLSTQEAASSFGDDRILVEKFVDSPRHIEIQVLGDKFGNAIYLNERECSIQRRNQKVIEEAPSTFLDEKTRKAMGEQAVALAKKINYDSAGTVEFLVDSKKNFYFLEMNTRLQVEHPITECITGVDLVEQMIRVAKGYELEISQKDIPIKGWAIESRVYAEDPYKNFGLPSVGRLSKYIEPLQLDKVRCDSGVTEGSNISFYYDPMICKLICYGDTREEAIAKSIEALDNYVIEGVNHNIPLLRDILTEKKFREGNITTNYLMDTYPNGFKSKDLTEQEKDQLLSVISAIYVKNSLRSKQLLNELNTSSTKVNKSTWDLIVTVNEEDFKCKLDIFADHFLVTTANSVVKLSNDFHLSSAIIEATFETRKQVVHLRKLGDAGEVEVRYKGVAFSAKVLSTEVHKYLKTMPAKPKVDMSKQILSPMPGLVKSVSCSVGDIVSEGQEVCVIEAMKMQNSLSAASNGKVKAVCVQEGATVDDEQLLIELE